MQIYRLSDNRCWEVKAENDSFPRFEDLHLCERHNHSQKQLSLDTVVYKFHVNEHAFILPDLEDKEEKPTVRKEVEEDYQSDRYFQEAKQHTVSVPRFSVHKRLVSRRCVFSQDFPASHAALKAFCGSVTLQDNSNAAYIGVFSNWKNEVVDLSCFTHCLTLPSLLRLLTSSDCGISDQALKQCICRLRTYKNMRHLYALYSAMKALAAFHPRCSPAVNGQILDKLPEKRSNEIDNTRIHLVLDYIVSCIELELLHYPLLRHRSREVSKLLAVDSPLLHRLIQETENRSSDVKTMALLQRAVAAVGTSDKWLFVDRLVSKLFRLYRRVRSVPDRQRLLASIAKPQLRLKLVECILSSRCRSYVRRPSKQFLSTDSVRALSSLLSEWLDVSSSSTVIGTVADQIEEYLAVVITYIESNLHIQKDITRSKDIRNIFLLHDQLSSSSEQASRSGELSLNAQVYLQQLYCLEDVYLA